MRVRQFLGQLVCTLTGWKVVGPKPEVGKYVLIAAPHTTNWDMPYMLALAWSQGIPVSWMGKHQIFRWPVAGMVKALGGVPVRRDRRNDLVSQVAKIYSERSEFVIVIPPEATRSRVEFWKSGFYRIAIAADVPIYFGFLDYPSKTGGFGSFVKPTEDVKRDMDVIRAFYADKIGKHPERFGPVRLKEEMPAGE